MRNTSRRVVAGAGGHIGPPLQGVLLAEGQSRKKADIYLCRQGSGSEKEKLVHSVKDNPPLNLIARGKSFRLRRSFSRALVASPVTSFSLLDRARPVCLRPKSRRFAAVGLRHAPAGAVSFPSGRKTGPPRGLPRGERRKERSRAQSSPLGGDGVGGVSSDDMGGAKDQPSSWLNPPPPVRASTGSRLDPDPFLPL